MQLFMLLATILLYFSGQLLAMEQPDIKNGVAVFFANNKKSTLSYKKLADLSRASMTIRYLLKDFDDEQKPELHLPSVQQEAFHIIMENIYAITNPEDHHQLCTEFNNTDLYTIPTLTNIIFAAEYLDLESIKKSAQCSLTHSIKSTCDLIEKNNRLITLEKSISILHPDQQKTILRAFAKEDCKKLFYKSAKKGHLKIAELLIKNYNLDKEDLNTALLKAAEKNQIQLMHLLLDEGANPDADNALTNAIKEKHYAAIKILLEYEADPNHQKYSIRPLSTAHISNAPKKIISLLKDYNAKISYSCIEYCLKNEITDGFTTILSNSPLTLNDYSNYINRLCQKTIDIKREIEPITLTTCLLIDHLLTLQKNSPPKKFYTIANNIANAAFCINNLKLLERAILISDIELISQELENSRYAQWLKSNMHTYLINNGFNPNTVREFTIFDIYRMKNTYINGTLLEFLLLIEYPNLESIDAIINLGARITKKNLDTCINRLNKASKKDSWDKEKVKEITKKIRLNVLE